MQYLWTPVQFNKRYGLYNTKTATHFSAVGCPKCRYQISLAVRMPKVEKGETEKC